MSQRLFDSPASLSERPLLRLILDCFETGLSSRHISLGDPTRFADVAALRSHIEQRITDGVGIVSGAATYRSSSLLCQR